MIQNQEQACVGVLVAMYDNAFGGKTRGRYRISMKLIRQILDQRRVWPNQVEAIRRGLYERGYVFIDMETYFVVVSHQTFFGYRRVNEAAAVLAAGEGEAG